MAKVYVFFLSIFASFAGIVPNANAQTATRSCWGNATGLNFNVQPHLYRNIRLPFLEMRVSAEEVVSVGEVHLNILKDETTIGAQFNPNEPPLGNPINIYALMLLSRGQVVHFEDYTNECNGPGLSFYPGQYVELARLKASLKDPFQIIIWARR